MGEWAGVAIALVSSWALLATQLVGEPITANLVLGLIAVFAGIWIATTEGGKEGGKA